MLQEQQTQIEQNVENQIKQFDEQITQIEKK